MAYTWASPYQMGMETSGEDTSSYGWQMNNMLAQNAKKKQDYAYRMGGANNVGYGAPGMARWGYSASATGGPMDEYNKKLAEANAANKARENEIRGIYDTRFKNMEGYGDQQLKDVDQGFASKWGQVQQDMISKGLGSSSLMPTQAMGVERERLGQRNRVSEGLQRLRDSLHGEKGAFIERINDMGPNADLYLKLAQMQEGGAGGYGGDVAWPSAGGGTPRGKSSSFAGTSYDAGGYGPLSPGQTGMSGPGEQGYFGQGEVVKRSPLWQYGQKGKYGYYEPQRYG